MNKSWIIVKTNLLPLGKIHINCQPYSYKMTKRSKYNRRVNKLVFDSDFHLKKKDLGYLIAIVEIGKEADTQTKESAIAAIARNIIGHDLRVNEYVLEFLVGFYDRYKDEHEDKTSEWNEVGYWLGDYDAGLRKFYEKMIQQEMNKGIISKLFNSINPFEYIRKRQYRRQIYHKFSEEIKDKIEEIRLEHLVEEVEEQLNYTVVVEFSDEKSETIKAITDVYSGLYERTGRKLKVVEKRTQNKIVAAYFFSDSKHVDEFQLLLMEGNIEHSVMPSERAEEYLKQHESNWLKIQITAELWGF